MKKDEVKAWIKEHKRVIIIGAGSAIVIGVLGYLGVKSYKTKGTVLGICNKIEVDIKLDNATVTEAWKELGNVNMILDDFKVTDIGELGKDFHIISHFLLSVHSASPVQCSNRPRSRPAVPQPFDWQRP